MSVLVAFDSFKGSLSAAQACESFAKGVRFTAPGEDVITMPIADGGDGFIDCLKDTFISRGWSIESVDVTGPYGDRVCAEYLIKGKEAFIEMAQSTGLTLVEPENRHAVSASSFGLGEVMAEAVRHGARTLYIGLGGSATNDLGLGCLQALGVEFFDKENNLINKPFKAQDLVRLSRLSSDCFSKTFQAVKVVAVCDVDNPLLGKNGATAVFGAQKGISETEMPFVERAMGSASSVLTRHFGFDCSEVVSAGAAGGMGAALMWFFNADVCHGVDTVLNLLDFDSVLKQVRYVVTGEGSFDEQSLSGKAPLGVLDIAKVHQKNVSLVAGRINASEETLSGLGFSSWFSLREIASDDSESMRRAEEFLFKIGSLWANRNLKI